MTASLLTQGTFFFPGPTEVRAEVLAAMTRPLIAHRGKAFESLYATLQAALLTGMKAWNCDSTCASVMLEPPYVAWM